MAATIVAIDGPSGVGKSTASRRVAARLGVPHIDTGAMYRAIAWKAIASGVDVRDGERLTRLAESTSLEFVATPAGPRLILDGTDISDQIRTPEISMAASNVSAVPGVRRVLVRLQQEMGSRNGGVLEGRDIGTKVFPSTPHKFFLTGRPEVRAERRRLDLAEKGLDLSTGDVLVEMEKRDRQDSTREDSPLTVDGSYHVIDTSDLTVDEVVEEIVRRVRAESRSAP